MRTTSNYALRLPTSLKRAIEEAAEKDGTTVNQFIVSAAAEKLSALKTAEYFARRRDRVDLAAFDRIMNRRGGTPPTPDDRLPAGYRRKRGAGSEQQN